MANPSRERAEKVSERGEEAITNESIIRQTGSGR